MLRSEGQARLRKAANIRDKVVCLSEDAECQTAQGQLPGRTTRLQHLFLASIFAGDGANGRASPHVRTHARTRTHTSTHTETCARA